MRVLVAGATGAIGGPLVRLLAQRGHEVLGTTRSEARAGALRALGAQPVICDALDADSVRQAVLAHGPEAIINELTALSAPLNPRRYAQWLEATNRLRIEATDNLAAAAAAAGTRRLISQSVAFAYRWDGEGLRSEEDPLLDQDMGFGAAIAAIRALERCTLQTLGLEGQVLRYGYLYGPGTGYAPGGDVAKLVRGRRYPIVGAGTGCFSFIHVDDAATATVAALEQPALGTFNIVDDQPAELREWLPFYAEVLGARPPRRVPLWLARLLTARFVADGAVRMPGASNARAKRELEWNPRWQSWRRGFVEALG